MRPLILVTNDDGIVAPGIRNLVEVASELGEVVVVAPDSPRVAKATLFPYTTLCASNMSKFFPA